MLRLHLSLALQGLDRRIRTGYLTSRDNEIGGVDDFFSSDPAIAGRWTGRKLVKDYGARSRGW